MLNEMLRTNEREVLRGGLPGNRGSGRDLQPTGQGILPFGLVLPKILKKKERTRRSFERLVTQLQALGQ